MSGLNTDPCHMLFHLTQPSRCSQDGLAQEAGPLHLEFRKLLQDSLKAKDGDINALLIVVGFT